jgi:HAD superfamily hydrolase (TIGR01450 family)
VSDGRRRDVLRLCSSDVPLVRSYDVVMFDLDGVVYRGPDPVPGAREHLARLRADKVAVAFVTNNASRSPEAVAERLRSMGVEAASEDVVTSAQAVARVMTGQLRPGARVLTVGGGGLVEALEEHGFTIVRSAEEDPEAVVQGFGSTVDWQALAEVAHAVNSGLPWFASNTDRTIPTARGVAPGNGMLVAAVRAAVDVDPVVAGKPEPALFDETVLRVGGDRPLVVGDRLDTDIEGANRVGADSLLVLTGVSRLRELAAATPRERPGYVAPGLGGLFELHPPLGRDGAAVTCGGWKARVQDDEVSVRAVSPGGGPIALVRAAVSAAWQHLDETGTAAGMQQVDDLLSAAMHSDADGRLTQ